LLESLAPKIDCIHLTTVHGLLDLHSDAVRTYWQIPSGFTVRNTDLPRTFREGALVWYRAKLGRV
jgi:hypothetical protein